jgi:flagellar M-ring protein FliF
MDLINKAYAQLAELFRSMTPGTRIAVGLLLAVVVVSLVYLFQYQAVGGDEFLLDGRPFSASEMTAIEAAFAQAGLGKSTIVGNRIRIPRGQKEVYLAALADNNALPADFSKYMDEAAASDNPFASTRSLELKRLNAKQKELALIISRMRGIASATVQYDEEIKHGLTRTKSKVAMVAVQTTSGSLEQDQIKAIRNIVASAYAGLDRQNITITDMTSNLSFGGTAGPDGMPDDESLYASHKQKYERDWQRKIAEQLSMIPGVIVGVNVELSPELQNSSQIVKIDPKPVTVSSSEFTKEASQQPASGGGRPGAVPNGVVGNQPVAISTSSQGPQSETSETRSQVQNLSGHEQRVIETAALVPTKVTASIDVPASYYTRIWNERNPSPAGQTAKTPDVAELAKIETETKDKIKNSVRNLLPPFAVGTDPYPHITVETYTDLPGSPPAPPSIASQAGNWFAENWRTLGTIGLGTFCLMMLRSMVRSTKTAPTPSPTSAVHAPQLHAASAADDPSEEAEEPSAVLKRRFSSSGPDLKAELRELVKENPDTAANILRAWIGDAA